MPSRANAEQRPGKHPCSQCGYQINAIDTFCPKCREAIATVRTWSLIGSIGAVVFALWTAYIVWDGFTWWALPTGLIGACCCLMLLEGLTADSNKLAKLAKAAVERERRASKAQLPAGSRLTPRPKGGQFYEVVHFFCYRSDEDAFEAYRILEQSDLASPGYVELRRNPAVVVAV